MSFQDTTKIWDINSEDDEIHVSTPVELGIKGRRSVGFQIRVNATGTGDLTGAFTVEVSNDWRVKQDIQTGNAIWQDTSTDTALWTDITSLLTTSATALAIADGDAGNSFVNISFLAAEFVRLKFTGSSGTDGSIEVWLSKI